MQQMMAQARKMQDRLADAQDQLADVEVSATAGGGAVRVNATADMRVRSIEILPDACDPNDVELLQDMLLAAVNDALAAAQAEADRRMAEVTGGLSIPGLF